MNFPFTTQQFFAIFCKYNEAVWPIQIILYLIALAIVFFMFTRKQYAGNVAILGLAFLWAWMGIVYHILFFFEVNPLAVFFGALFILQALLFVYVGIKDRIQCMPTSDLRVRISIF